MSKTSRAQQGNGVPWFGIGIENNKNPANLGVLWRSAVCLRASFIFTIGRRYRREASDTVNAPQHIPCYEYTDRASFLRLRPLGAPLVGIELADGAKPLPAFTHPRRAVYLLGPEDGSISAELQAACTYTVEIPSVYCLNVATAGAIVMYDRAAKLSG